MMCVRLLVSVVLMAWLAVPAIAQEVPPTGKFSAVHLDNFTPDELKTVQAWMDDVNAMLAKAGHKDIQYRLYTVTGRQNGAYAYMWESSWPSGAVYNEVHKNPEWDAANKRHPAMEAILKDEVYNRFVEVPAAKR